MKYPIIYIICLVVLLLLDFLWLGVLAKNFYKDQIGELMADKFNIIPALIFYVIYPVAIIVFALTPGVTDMNLTKTLMLAAFLGFISYGTYNFTNYATLREWPLKVLLVDLSWGTFVTSATALVGYLFSVKFLS